MALVASATLSGNVGLSDRFVKLSAFTNPATVGLTTPVMLVIDGETMLVTDTSNSPTLGVVRGYSSVTPGVPTLPACAHKTLAPVVYGLSSDFTQSASTDGRAAAQVLSIAVNDSNVTLPPVDTVVYLTKAGVLALTINGPNNDQTNKITFISLTANAHTITYTAGFYQNTTSSDVATFPSTSGACFTIVAKNGLWNALSNFSSAGVTVG